MLSWVSGWNQQVANLSSIYLDRKFESCTQRHIPELYPSAVKEVVCNTIIAGSNPVNSSKYAPVMEVVDMSALEADA